MNVRTAASSIHGIGVFANEKIKIGTSQYVYGDIRDVLPGDPIEHYGVVWGDKTYIPYAPWCCVNHSDIPNCEVNELDFNYPMLMITALLNIEKDQELTIDYGFSFTEWRSVPGYKKEYEISSDGQVRSLKRIITRSNNRKQTIKRRLLKQFLTNGYLSVSLRSKTMYVHELVALAFFGNRPKGYQILHGPKGQLINSIDNLRYGSPIENSHDWHLESDVWRAIRRSDGQEFPSLHEASRQTPNSDVAHIIHVAQGRRKSHAEFGWCYI